MCNSEERGLSARKISAGDHCSPTSSTAQLLLKDVVGAQKLILAGQERGESGDYVSRLIYQHPSNELGTRNTAEHKN